jgi:ubiquinone/menaquinone biosynthesis C-methylase UbiE
MNDYQIIFQKRATNYHYAMQQFPEARKHEFDNLFSGINFENDIHLLDVPSGGGYLRNYTPKNTKVTLGDFSEGFAINGIQLVTPEKLPFESNTFDAVFSLSGMHHLKDVPQFIRECLRVTKTGGSFIFADVKKGTSVDVFLNEFANTYNSLGHKGDFFQETSFEAFTDIQSCISNCQYKEYPFLFANTSDMITFFKLFFGLDKASNSIIHEGIENILGIKNTSKGIEVNWGLLLFQLKKE